MIEAKICSGIEKYIGYMFKTKKTKAVLLVNNKKTKANLHTWFVFFPLNIYFLDEDFKVTETKKAKPFSFIFPNKESKFVLESWEDLNLKINEKVEIKFPTIHSKKRTSINV